MSFKNDKYVAERYGVSRATVWNWVRAGKLPKPVKLSAKCTRWSVDQLDRHDLEMLNQGSDDV